MGVDTTLTYGSGLLVTALVVCKGVEEVVEKRGCECRCSAVTLASMSTD